MNKVSKLYYLYVFDRGKRKFIRRDGHFVSTNKSFKWFKRHVVLFKREEDLDNYKKYVETLYKEHPEYSFEKGVLDLEKEVLWNLK